MPPSENDTTPATTEETKPVEAPRPARATKPVAPPESTQAVPAPTPPVGAWRFVVDDVERLVTITRRGDGCVAASLDEREATAEADDVAVNILARLLGRAGRDVVVLAPGAVRK